MTREQIEAIRDGRIGDGSDGQQTFTWHDLQALCTLALEALDKHGLEVKDSADYLVEAYNEQRIETLEAENERLQRERDQARAKAIEAAAAVANHWLGPDSYCEDAILALKDTP